MTAVTTAPTQPTAAFESATRVAVVAALSATTMLFASLVSAYLVRRSFADWRPAPAVWPRVLLALASWASMGMEVAVRGEGTKRAGGFMSLALASGLYLIGALAVILSIALGQGGLTAPHNAFIVMLLGVHVAHAVLGAAFAIWTLRGAAGDPSENSLLLARLVTHFLAVLLFAIVFLLFVLQ